MMTIAILDVLHMARTFHTPNRTYVLGLRELSLTLLATLETPWPEVAILPFGLVYNPGQTCWDSSLQITSNSLS